MPPPVGSDTSEATFCCNFLNRSLQRRTNSRQSFKPDSTVDDLDAVFSPEVDAPAKAAGSNDLFNESAVEYSGLELHETDEERDAAILSDDLFESDPQTGEQGDED